MENEINRPDPNTPQPIQSINLFKLQMADGKLSVSAAKKPDTGQKDVPELIDMVKGLLQGGYSKVMVSNKRVTTQKDDVYFEITMDTNAIKLVERNSIRRQEYVVDLAANKVFFNQREVSHQFCADIARRLAKYGAQISENPRIPIVGIRNESEHSQ
ncbi:hypothetical protein EBR96_08565 [bacterium]|nr:hypothetical protein [bacterium]